MKYERGRNYEKNPISYFRSFRISHILMKLIVGLGNPGKEYEKTRHNVGFMVLDALHDSWKLNKKFNAEIAETTLNDVKVILAKPLTFMNASGEAVQTIAHFYKINPEDIIVVHDDKDIPLGTVKVQKERGDAGHNGVRSIVEHLKSNAFTRVRVGTASENKRKMQDTTKFVLSRFGLFEKTKFRDAIELAIQKIKELL